VFSLAWTFALVLASSLAHAAVVEHTFNVHMSFVSFFSFSWENQSKFELYSLIKILCCYIYRWRTFLCNVCVVNNRSLPLMEPCKDQQLTLERVILLSFTYSTSHPVILLFIGKNFLLLFDN